MERASAGRRVAPVVLPFIVLAVFTALGASESSAWIELSDVPAPSQGDIVFYVDVVTFREDAGLNREEIYCIVPNEQIKFVETDGRFEGDLRYEIRLLDQNGDVAGVVEKSLEVSAASGEDAADRTVVQVFQSKIKVPPGRYRVKVTIKDLNAVKRSIIGLVFRQHRTGQVTLEIDSKGFEQGKLTLSDIEFARSLRLKAESGFQKSGFEVIPNARRRYGLLLPELAIFFEAYDLREKVAEDTLSATYSIINRSGGKIFTSSRPLIVRQGVSASTALFDVTSLPAGTYLLAVDVSDRHGNALGTSERKFDVVWSVISWGKYEAETIEEMAYILTEDEMKAFETLSPGSQEEYLKEFWLKVDPTPGTVQNEALEEHYRRIRYADEHFAGAAVRGALSDRGRIYIKYGAPDDQQSFYSDYEFVKGTWEMEGGTSPVPTDPFSRVGIKAGGDQSAFGTGSDLDAHSDQRGGSTVHGKGYEVWSYDGAGNPVRRVSKRVPTSPAMRFMFIDEKGNGEYRLIYSTEKQEY